MSVVVPLMCLFQLFLCSPFRCLSSHPRWLCAHLRSPLCLPPASSLSDHLSLSCWLPPCSPCCKNLPGSRARKGGNLYLEPEKADQCDLDKRKLYLDVFDVFSGVRSPQGAGRVWKGGRKPILPISTLSPRLGWRRCKGRSKGLTM